MTIRPAGLLGVYLLTCGFAGNGLGDVQPGDAPPENVRIVLTINQANEEPASFSIVCNGGEAEFDSLAGTTQIDENHVPVLLRFKAHLTSLGEGAYDVAVVFGTSRPVVTSTSTGDRGGRSTFQYQDIGAQANVRMKTGQELTFLQDPEKSVTLKLERVDTQ